MVIIYSASHHLSRTFFEKHNFFLRLFGDLAKQFVGNKKPEVVSLGSSGSVIVGAGLEDPWRVYLHQCFNPWFVGSSKTPPVMHGGERRLRYDRLNRKLHDK